MIIIFEGPDNVGKGTQIQKILPYLHDRPTHQLHYSAVTGFNTPEETKEYSEKTYFSMFKLLHHYYEEFNFVLDRSHIGEMVYAPLYRNYDGDYVLEIEKVWMGYDFWKQIYLITFVDDPENLIKRDDGLSFTIEPDKKKDEINRFMEAFKKSNIKYKHTINVFNKSIDQVHEEVRKYLDV